MAPDALRRSPPADRATSCLPRVEWVGVSRLRWAAVVSVILLHVTLTGAARHLSVAPSYRQAAVLVSSVFSNETLVFLALLLGMARPRAEPDWDYVRGRLVRIGLPFLAFTAVFVAEDLIWIRHGVLFRYPPVEATVLLIVAGLGKYHLHFLPALIVLTASLRLYRLPLPLALVLALLGLGAVFRVGLETVVLERQTGGDPPASDLLLLHLGKVVSYGPYGFLAGWFAREGFPRDLSEARRRLVLRAALAVLIVVLALGVTPAAPGGARWGVLPVGGAAEGLLQSAAVVAGIFAVMSLPGPIERAALSGRDAGHSELAFLVLMLHPLLLDAYLALVPAGRSEVLRDVLCSLFVLSGSLTAAIALAAVTRVGSASGSAR